MAAKIGAETERIVPKQEAGMGSKAMRAFLRMRAAIMPMKTDLADVDCLVVATPVWAQSIPGYVSEFCAQVTNGNGKPFGVLVEMGGSGDAKAIAAIRRRLEAKGMRFVGSVTTIEKDVEANRFEQRLEPLVAVVLAEESRLEKK
jgi:NAD(P)H-dependent FMN reductase